MKAKATPRGSNPWQRVAPFAVLSLISFLCGMGVLAVMLWKADRLIALGLVGNLYYLVLIPLGLSAATFLFGVLRSYAVYTGKVLGGTLELGGPIVAAALVVIGGFYLPKPAPEAFTITVLVHGEAGPHDLVLRNVGIVWMTLGPDRRQERIGDKGQADFKNIPASFRGQEVPVSVEAGGFEMASPSQKYLLGGPSIDVVVRRKAAHLTGRVQDTEGRPITNATVRIGDVQTRVDTNGHFSLILPVLQESGEVSADVLAPGFKPWHGRFTPNAGEATVQLHQGP